MTVNESQPHGDGRILTRSEGRVLVIGIDRPEKHNAFTPKMLSELGEAFTEYEGEERYRCAVVHGVGPNFTAGFDLRAVHIGPEIFPARLIDPLDLRPPHRRKPVVVAVHGVCFTLGVELALAADIVVAAANTRFAQLEVKRGLVSFGGATIRMVERAGWGNAMRFLLTGDEFGPETARRLGFIQEIVDPGSELGRAMELAQAVARQAPLAVAAMRESARTAATRGLAAAVDEFPALVARTVGSEDFREGVRAFLEKRQPEFVGR